MPTGIDTRELTKKIREEGTMLGRVVCGEEEEEESVFEDPNARNLVQEVSCQVSLGIPLALFVCTYIY